MECCVGRDGGDAGGDGAFECADGRHGVCGWGCQHCCCDTHLQGVPLSSTSIWIAVSVYAVSHQQNASATITRIITRTSLVSKPTRIPRGSFFALAAGQQLAWLLNDENTYIHIVQCKVYRCTTPRLTGLTAK